MLQTLDETTGTLTVANSSEFTNDYKRATKSITISYGFKEISSGAFYEWPFLISAEIRGTVTVIDDYAFFSYFSLKNTRIPSSITSIKDSAF